MNTPAAAIAQFRVALIGLDLDDEGLTRRNGLQRLELVARLSYEAIAATADATTPYELLVNRLARCTQRLLMTVFNADPKAVQDFMFARAELLELDGNTRRNGR